MRPSEDRARKCALALYAKQLEQYLAAGGIITQTNKKNATLSNKPVLDIHTGINNADEPGQSVQK